MTTGDIIWKRVDLRRRNLERKHQLLFQRVLSLQFAEVAAAVRTDNAMNADKLVDLITTTPIEKAMMRLYEEVGIEFARDTFQQFKGKKDEYIDNWLAFMRSYVTSKCGNKIVSIAEGSREQALKLIRAAIDSGIEEGRGTEEIARRIRNSLMRDSIPMNQMRAVRIARTEVVGASNIGAMEGARETGQPMEKYWIAQKDGRARDSHTNVELSGPVPLDEPFYVDGIPAEMPGDPSLPAEEVINCRCSVAFKVIAI